MSDKTWYTAVGGQQQGPYSLEELVPRFQSGELGLDTYVYNQGMGDWVAASTRPEFARAAGGPAAAPPAAGANRLRRRHRIRDLRRGDAVRRDHPRPRRSLHLRGRAFMYMDPGIEMETIFGDGSGQGAGTLFDKFLTADKRVLTGELLFMTVFANSGHQRQTVAFASPYPGADHRHRPRPAPQHPAPCAAKGVSVDIAFQRKLGAGLFGGEGFILQKLEGDGLAFMHAGGTVVERDLQPGETLRLDTGCLVAFEEQVDYDIQMVKGIKSAIFGGEGMFYAALTGPGTVWMQSLPFSRLAKRVYAAAPQTGGTRKGERSVAGVLGDLMIGDR